MTRDLYYDLTEARKKIPERQIRILGEAGTDFEVFVSGDSDGLYTGHFNTSIAATLYAAALQFRHGWEIIQ